MADPASPRGALSFKAAALIAGFGLLLMTVCAPPAFFIFLPQGVVPDDAAATLDLLRGEGGRPYLIGAFLLFATYCLDLVVTWGLFWLFRPTQAALAQFVAWSRLIYTALAFAGLMFTFQAYDLAVSENLVAAIGIEALQVEVMVKAASGSSMTGLALFFFGFHLLIVSAALWCDTRTPTWLSLFVGLAGLSYIAQHALDYLSPGTQVEWLFLLALGELVFMFWLLVTGFRSDADSMTHDRAC
ncbi:MAG: DUF4386 domain-containing protein [Pseudomonadota bacterium]